MTEAAKMRMERIERLLRELEYEVTRGMMEREVDEHIGFRFVVPVSQRGKGWVVEAVFQTRPSEVWSASIPEDKRVRIKLVE